MRVLRCAHALVAPVFCTLEAEEAARHWRNRHRSSKRGARPRWRTQRRWLHCNTAFEWPLRRGLVCCARVGPWPGPTVTDDSNFCASLRYRISSATSFNTTMSAADGTTTATVPGEGGLPKVVVTHSSGAKLEVSRGCSARPTAQRRRHQSGYQSAHADIDVAYTCRCTSGARR